MAQRISRYIIPPTGWKFPNGRFWIEGETFDELLTNVIAHRAANGFPDGNAEQEIEDWLAANNKDFVIQNK